MNKSIITILVILVFILSGCYNDEKSVLSEIEDDNTQELADNTAPEVDLENLKAEVPILIYHHIREILESDSQNAKTFIVSPNNFEKQLIYLSENNFTSISFDNLNDYFEGKFTMPEKPVIISFDDGVINQYENALPLLEKYDMNATFFLFTNPIDKNDNYLNSDQLKEMDKKGMEFGIHGWYHLYLHKEKDEEVLDREIIKSKKLLEEIIDKEITAFSYPFGTYLPETIERIKNTGYFTARDIINGKIHTRNDLFTLNGYFITENFSRFKNIVD
jgi:peptidoglycan/xylan/chitin deacetylase (PgdA/CDA1 family)